MLNKLLYLEEMMIMVDKAIYLLENENTDFKIYTASIWTDPNAAKSSIGIDSKSNSFKKVEESNEWNKKYYEQYLAEGDLEQAALFRPNNDTRVCNPADFKLKDFGEISHQSFPKNWESETDGECWNELEPLLIEVGTYTFLKVKNLRVEEGFELSINSHKDWYDKTWKID